MTYSPVMGKHQAAAAKAAGDTGVARDGGGRVLRASAIALAFSLVVAACWYVVVHRDGIAGAGERCPRTLDVVTASSFAPVLAAAGRTLRGGGNCVQVDVKISEGRSAAADVAQSGADAWIPDDAAWTATIGAQTLAPKGNGGAGTILANSPIYLVTDAATATRIRDAGGTWLGLANLLTANPAGMHLVVRDPSGSGDGMVAAGAVGEAVWDARGMDASSLALADTEKVTRTVGHALAATPELAGDVGLVPEYALLPTLGVPAGDRTYLAPSDHTAQLRFTWLPSAAALGDAKRSSALGRLFAAFRTPEVQTAIAAAGLRGPDNVRPALPGAEKLPPVEAKPFEVLAPHHVQHIFATWDPEDRRSNLLILLDVSTPAKSTSAAGSTAAPSAKPSLTPKTGASPPASALDVLRQGCRSVANLLPDGSRLGLWEVGAGFDPPNAYRKLVVTQRLDDTLRTTTNRAVDALSTHRAGPGLLSAVVDGYSAVQRDYQADMVNQVLVFTDDQNGDMQNAAAVADLAARLGALRDPERPVHLSIVLLGPHAGADKLTESLKVVDAYVETATGADDVQADFIHVLAGGLHE
jgi:hypothetical protein